MGTILPSEMRARFLVATAAWVLAATYTACTFSCSTAHISKVTVSKNVTEKMEPVDATTVFPQDQSVLHCLVHVANAPSDTKVKSVWVAVETEKGKDVRIDSVEYVIHESSDIHFTLTRGRNPWPAGKYRVELYLDGKFDRDVDFTVEKTTLLTNVMLCKDVTKALEPIAPTFVFPQNQPAFHCVLDVVNAGSNTKVKSVWIVVEAGENKNVKIDEAEVSVSGDVPVHFTLKRGQNLWPAGKYRLELYLNDEPKYTVDFTVRGNAH